MTHTHAGMPALTPSATCDLSIREHALDEGVCVIELEGDIDLATAPAVKSVLSAWLKRGYRRFVLDLAGVVCMDSTGLSVLVGFQRRLGDAGLLALASPSGGVRRLFEVTGLDTRFAVFPTLSAVMDDLAPTSEVNQPSRLSDDAALVLGLASTALPFADSRDAEAERWLRILRLHGNAGCVLRAVGVSDAQVVAAFDDPDEPVDHGQGAEADVVASVLAQAARAASRHGAETIDSADLLVGVMTVYGASFDRGLRSYGGDQAALLEHWLITLRLTDHP